MAEPAKKKNKQTKQADICFAVHKNTREHTLEYVRAKKQIAGNVRFHHLLFLFSFSHKIVLRIAYQLNHFLS